ncbi:unnamed protein product [Rotaria socialis]|uniref:Uncharacterized protein n=1 Tax=Rotaria socialis TaxID=392032 RepID=A0A817XRK8_9BILA|nr:unnamed protein product [Rotaria socialis]
MNLIEIDDVFSILQFESDRTLPLKEILGISVKNKQDNYSFFIMPGIRLKLEKIIRSLRSLIPSIDSLSSSTTNALTISSELVQQYPFLVDLVYSLESNLLTDFSLDFLSNMISNATRSKSSFRYKQSIKDFATSMFILGGRCVYEFVRLNIPGSIPSLTSLRLILTSSKCNFIEVLPSYQKSHTILDLTISLGELETWYEQIDKSDLINVHDIQPTCHIGQVPPPPFLLAAYGTNSVYTGKDVLARWSRIFDSCMAQNIRVLGFSADCDPKQLKAMRESMGFFSRQPTDFEDHPNCFNISLLKIIQFVRFAFVEKNTTIIDRLYYSWCAVFIVRLWSAWLESIDSADIDEKIFRLLPIDFSTPISKPQLFITVPCLFSLELNAHSLTYLAVLVAEQKISEDALNVSLFNSQMCESTFRAARSMSGPFSSVVNFSVNEFLQRVEKLALLQTIRWSSDCNMNNLVFPKHHKQSQNSMAAPSTSTTTITITEELLEKTVFNAYVQAKEILSGCEFSILDSSEELISFDEVNRIAYKKLTKSKCKISKKKTSASNKVEEEEEEIENEYDDDDKNEEQHQLDKRYSENNTTNEDEESMLIDELDFDVLPEVSSSTVNGMRIFDSIDNCQNESFFSVEVNGQKKYLHKQTANWYFSKTKPISSSDRLKRVQEKK